MAITAQQRERIKKALFYANQNPDEAVDAIVALLEGVSDGSSSVTVDNTLTKSGQAADAKVVGDKLKEKLSATKMPTQADSTATGTDVDTLKTDFNSLLAKLKTAGLMA